MTISMDKEYRTRDGRKVRLFVTDAHHPYYPVRGEVHKTNGEWDNLCWTADGKHFVSGDESTFDLIEVTLLDVLKPGDKVICIRSGGEELRRYVKRVEDYLIVTFDGGCDGWTANDDESYWSLDSIRLPTSEELGESK